MKIYNHGKAEASEGRSENGIRSGKNICPVVKSNGKGKLDAKSPDGYYTASEKAHGKKTKKF